MTRKVDSALSIKDRMSSSLLRRINSTCLAEQLPRRIQTTFGGAPYSRLIVEIGILAGQSVVMLSGVLPHLAILSGAQPNSGDMPGVRKHIRQTKNQGRREVLVKQEFQAFTASW